MEWRRAGGVLGLCGACREPIGPGDTYGRTRTGSLRCQACATRIAPPPPTIVDDADPASSLPAPLFDTAPRTPEFVSVSEMARRRTANHFRQRKRR